MTEKNTLGVIAEDIIGSAQSRRLYGLADLMSSHITHHNYQHGLRVSQRAIAIAAELQRHFPGTFKQEHLDFHVKLAGFGHDLGRSHGSDIVDGKPVDRTAYWSARILRPMMEERGVSRRDQLLVLYPIVNHSSGPSRTALRKIENLDKWHQERRLLLTPLVMADMADSYRPRVRREQRPWIRALIKSRNALSYFDNKADQNFRNWMACYAVRESELIVDPNDTGNNANYKGSIILRWELDERVCTIDRILTKIDWVKAKLHGCENAAQNIHNLNFGVEVNGARWFFSKDLLSWYVRPSK